MDGYKTEKSNEMKSASESFSEILGIMRSMQGKDSSEKMGDLDRLLNIIKDNPENLALLNAVRTHPNHSQIPINTWKQIASISDQHDKFVKLNSHIKLQLQSEEDGAIHDSVLKPTK